MFENGGMEESGFLTAPEAAMVLGVKLETLYAYVSRGLIRSERIAAGRRRRYRRADVLRLRQRAEVRSDPSTAARQAFERSAAPILDSELTLITERELYYRGQPVTKLARTHTFEQVVALLWSGDLEAAIPALVRPVLPKVRRRWVRAHGRPLEPWFAFQSVLPRLAAADAAAEDLSPPPSAARGRASSWRSSPAWNGWRQPTAPLPAPARGLGPGAPPPGGRPTRCGSDRGAGTGRTHPGPDLGRGRSRPGGWP